MDDFARDTLIQIVSDPAFWIGAIVIPVLVLALLRFVGMIMSAINAILTFFQPTETPGRIPTNEGASPFASLMGCFAALLGLAALLAVVAGVAYWVLF